MAAEGSRSCSQVPGVHQVRHQSKYSRSFFFLWMNISQNGITAPPAHLQVLTVPLLVHRSHHGQLCWPAFRFFYPWIIIKQTSVTLQAPQELNWSAKPLAHCLATCCAARSHSRCTHCCPFAERIKLSFMVMDLNPGSGKKCPGFVTAKSAICLCEGDCEG